MTSVMWFRRDLRLTDHAALARAAETGPVLGLFVIDPHLWDKSGAVRRVCLLRSLDALNEAMDGQLVVRVGSPTEVVPAVAKGVGASTVFISADFAPYGQQRDADVERALLDDQVALESVGSPYAVNPGVVRKSDGTPYQVFTPFYRAWCDSGWLAPVANIPPSWLNLVSDPWPTAELPAGVTLPAIGEQTSLDLWRTFHTDLIDEYPDHRDRPDLGGTSSLSMALRWGHVHPRTLLAELNDSRAHDVYRRELCWREFYADVLFHVPQSARHSLKPTMQAMRTDSGATADARFAAWAEGRTGYPFVDAGMRQLLAEGWIHNRVRMVVASFLVKDLHLDWQRGASHFMEWLRDGDIASNQHGWQWAAGTGTDAAPYFRVFNPVTQGIKFDPDGDYVRKYIPELAQLPGASAHTPWDAPLLAAEYPERIVDHSVERNEALARLAELKN